jgi:DNA-binding CsgD family transcriptional regulator
MLKNLNKSVRNKQFFAFSIPLEEFFKIDDNVLVYWKDLESVYFGCNDLLAAQGKLPSSTVVGKTDHDFVLNEQHVETLQKNDHQVMVNNAIKVFFEKVDYNNGHSFYGLSLKTPLMDSRKNIVGIFGISFFLNDNNFSTISNTINKLGIIPSVPILKLPDKVIADKKKLTACETQCLYYTVKGKSARETGEILYRSRRTIEDHIVNIKDKLGCRTKSELIEKVLDEGLLR